MKKQLKGIALILFGILLSVSAENLNETVFSNISDVPLAIFGIIIGIVGVIYAFTNEK